MNSTPQRRIALVASSFAPYIGGVEQHTAEVARELSRRGHAVEVWTVDRGEHLGIANVEGITARYLATPLPSGSPSGIARFVRSAPAAWRAWRSAHKDFAPEVLHVQCFGPNGVYADLLGRVTRTPRLVSSHGETQADDLNVFERSLLLRTSLKTAVATSVVTGCSRSVVEDLTSRFGAQGVTVVPNGVGLESLAGVGDVERDPRRIVGVGRLEHNKGFDLLLLAASLLPDDVTLELVGDGSEAEPLTNQAIELGMSDRFRITGKLEHEGVLRRIAGAGAICVPSRKEAFGIVVLEGWAVGTPVVATSLAGPSEFVTDGVDGILVDPRDPRALAVALSEALAPDRAASLSEHGFRTVRDFTWVHTADLYEALYAAMLGDS